MKRRPRVVVLGVSLLLVFIAGVLLLVARPMPGVFEAIATIVPSLPGDTLQRVLVVTLIVIGVLLVRTDRGWGEDHRSLLGDRHPPERPHDAPSVFGDRFDDQVSAARTEIRLQETPYDRTEPRKTLRTLLVRAIALERECTMAYAVERVDNGDWTTDPVAGAFVSDELEYPVRFQLYRWARSTDAYTRAVERTVVELDSYLDSVATVRSTGRHDSAADGASRWGHRDGERGQNDHTVDTGGVSRPSSASNRPEESA